MCALRGGARLRLLIFFSFQSKKVQEHEARAQAAAAAAPAPAEPRVRTEKPAGPAGGAYIPPFKLAQMMREVDDKASPAYQRLTWDALRKSINGLVNKVNAANIKHLLPELFGEARWPARARARRSLLTCLAGRADVLWHVCRKLLTRWVRRAAYRQPVLLVSDGSYAASVLEAGCAWCALGARCVLASAVRCALGRSVCASGVERTWRLLGGCVQQRRLGARAPPRAAATGAAAAGRRPARAPRALAGVQADAALRGRARRTWCARAACSAAAS